ncbi:MAG: DUF2510 domain-containing protein [Coriobacteriales bacterium]|jgi:hypothetical protein|nr:DUF2510 domain-containing protein [Coriobacteriales bacterium]
MAEQQAGWYPDPSGDTSKLRYWDGSQWTDQFADAAPPQQQNETVVATVVTTADDGRTQEARYTYQQVPAEPSNPLAIASMICGIVGLCFGLISIAAIVLAVMARKQPGNQGMATAGLVLGIIGVVGWILVLIFYGVLFAAYVNFM